MRRHDQAIELVVGVVGEREHHPVLAAFAGADFDAADDAVRAGRRGNLDAIGVAVLMLQHRRQVDGRHVAADADRVDSPRRGGRHHHEAQQERRRFEDPAPRAANSNQGLQIEKRHSKHIFASAHGFPKFAN